MKKFIISIFAVGLFTGCISDDDFERANKDPKNPDTVSQDALFVSAQKSLVDQMISTNQNQNIYRLMSQYWTQTTYTDESNYLLTQRNIPQSHWSAIYRNVLFDLKDAKQKINETEITILYTQARKDAQLAMVEVVEVYAWSNLVDTFSNIPYSQSLDAETYPLPAYDDAATIYTDLFARLDTAISLLDSGAEGFASGDKYYGGDIAKWKKFANSLRLRMAMRLADKDSGKSIMEANKAITSGVFTSNTDNAKMAYETNSTNANPLWKDLVESGRNDFIPSEGFLDLVVAKNDPRVDEYFEMNVATYKGGVYGLNNSYTSFSHIGDLLHVQDASGYLLDYAEVSFHLAEAAARGGYATTMPAEGYYNVGVTASIEDWGGTTAEATAYLAGAGAYDTTNWKKSVAEQAWIAAYNSPFQGWCIARKFDNLPLVVAANSGENSPLRYTYPVNEQNLNNSNREAAAAAIGGDLKTTPVFWDVN